MLSYGKLNRIIRLVVEEKAVYYVIVGFGAIDGIVTSYAISYILSLSPFIAGLSPITVGGIISVGLLRSLFITSLLADDFVSCPVENTDLGSTRVNGAAVVF